MVSTFGNNIVSAFTGGQSVKAIYTYGEKVWPNEPSVYYMSWLPSDLSGSFTIGESTYNFEDYGGYFSDFDGVIPSNCFVSRGFTRFETNAYSVGRYAFGYCTSLYSVYLSNCSMLSAGNEFFSCNKLRTVSLPKCESIGSYTFYDCYSLSTVNLPNCYVLDQFAFAIHAGSNRKQSLNISCPTCYQYSDNCFNGRNLVSAQQMDFTSCTIIGSYAFESAIGMYVSYPTYEFPRCVTIYRAAFEDCGMVNVKLSVPVFIDDYAFAYRYDAWDIHPTRKVSIYASGVCMINTEAFKMLKNGSWVPGWNIYVPSSLVSAYKAEPNWSDYSSYIYPITD